MSQTAPTTSPSVAEAGVEQTPRGGPRPLTFGRVVQWLLVLACTVSAEVGIDAVAAQQSLLGLAPLSPPDTVWVARVDTVFVEHVDTVFASSGDARAAVRAHSPWDTAVVALTLFVGLVFGVLAGAAGRARSADRADGPTPLQGAEAAVGRLPRLHTRIVDEVIRVTRATIGRIEQGGTP